MPAALTDQTASSVAPDEIFRPQRLAVGQLDVDAGVVLREARHLTPAIDRHRQLADPAGQDALDVVLPQPEPVVVPGGKVADVQRDAGRTPRPEPPVPPRGTDRRFRADREPRWCVSADRLRASRGGPGWRAARQSATSTPANANSPASISPVGPPPAITTACSVIATLRPASGRSRNQSSRPRRRSGARAGGTGRPASRRAPKARRPRRRTRRARVSSGSGRAGACRRSAAVRESGS